MRRRELIAGLIAVAIVVAPAVAASQTTPQELAVKLTPAQRQIYDDYRRAREAFEVKLRGYWGRVDAKRDARRAKHMLAQPPSTEDYVAEQPPNTPGGVARRDRQARCRDHAANPGVSPPGGSVIL